MNKHALEVSTIGGDALMKSVRKEFSGDFFIVARNHDDLVLGDGTKNVKFSRKNNRILERHIFETSRGITRK
jgi:hypothetical protein